MLNINESLLSELTMSEYWLLSHIGNFVGANDECWPSNATLVERSGMSLSALKRARKGLVAKGIVTVKYRKAEGGKTNATNLYKVMTDKFSVYTRSAQKDSTGGGFSQDPGVGSHRTPGGSHRTPKYYPVKYYPMK